ncbi:MAG TPA: tetracycline resistance ribosomal protection protein [Firmicutes bacterium]|jgi:ribosomal protection tetracycline resistance protein|nr:tetracycline resistance ribosomal protection protein [Bacillota bacterium]
MESRMMNIGILAHVDAGKTTVTESMLFESGAISSAGGVDQGTTITDSMHLERERGITIRAATISFQWENTKINLIDTPGHMDFIAEVERSLRVLDGAVLVISAKEGVQAQTRIIFNTLKRLKIPTLIYLNKLDRIGVDLLEVYSRIREQLTEKIMVMQSVHNLGEPDITITDYQDDRPRDAAFTETLLDADESLMEKFIENRPISGAEFQAALLRGVAESKIYPVLHGCALRNIGTRQLLHAITHYLPGSPTQSQGELSAYVYQIDRDEQHRKRIYVRVFNGALAIRNIVPIYGKDQSFKIKTLEKLESAKRIPAEYVSSGDVAILSKVDGLQCGDIIGNAWRRQKDVRIAEPTLEASVIPVCTGDRVALIKALDELTEEDSFLQLHINPQTAEITVRLFGEIQMEVIKGLVKERYQVDLTFGPLRTIYKERPKRCAEAVIYMALSPHPYCSAVGLSIEPLPLHSGLVYESKVSYGYLKNSFQIAVREGVQAACRQGLFGWEITDIKVCFTFGQFFSPISTPSDFRQLAPSVLRDAIKKAGTELLEPYMSYCLEIPKEFNQPVMADLQKMQASIEGIESKGEMISICGKVPDSSSKSYAAKLLRFTDGKGVFTSRVYGYELYQGEPVYKNQV